MPHTANIHYTTPPMHGPRIALAQKHLGLKQTGIADADTCAAFVAWKWKVGYPGKFCLPILGETGFAYLTGAKPVPNAFKVRALARRIRKAKPPVAPSVDDLMRRAIVEAAAWAYDRRSRFVYAQVRPMADSIYSDDAHRKTDCSSYATLSFKAAGAPNPNGHPYNGAGYTGEMQNHGTWTNDWREADLALYGPSRSNTTHVAIVVRRRNIDQLNRGVPFLEADVLPGFGVLSFGHTPITYYDTVAYRGDLVGVKTYPMH